MDGDAVSGSTGCTARAGCLPYVWDQQVFPNDQMPKLLNGGPPIRSRFLCDAYFISNILARLDSPEPRPFVLPPTIPLFGLFLTHPSPPPMT
jgi:hypothetical protein